MADRHKIWLHHYTRVRHLTSGCIIQLDCGSGSLDWSDTIHAQRVQLQHPEVTAIFDIDQTAAAAMRNQLLPKLAGADVLIASPHSSAFPPVGRLRKDASGYNWVQVVFTDRWDENAPSPQR
jgi:hypothetical protein